MNVIKRKVLETFWEAHGGKKPLLEWFKIARKARWNHFAELKQTFGSADAVKLPGGKTATVFDVGGNKFRIIALVDYTRQRVLVTHVLTHKQYDAESWKYQL